MSIELFKDELMEALGVSRIGNLTYALSHLPGRDDIERLKAFCNKHDIMYSVEDAYKLNIQENDRCTDRF